MADKKICITTDCVCDLPDQMLEENNIDVVYFYIETDTGRFRDVDEITAQNIFEYLLDGGKKTETTAPPIEEFVAFFKEKLEKYDEIIHIAVSSKLSMCVENSTQAINQLGDDGSRVHIFDSEHLTTSMGHMVLRAAEMLDRGCGSEEILSELEQMKKKVSTTFMANNADYLYRNGRVSKTVKKICNAFNIHPVLEVKNGCLSLKSIQIGSYEKSAMKYIRSLLKNKNKIQKKRLFITHAGCSVSDIKMVKREVNRYMDFDSIVVAKASATISGNSGPRTIAILFVEE